MNQIIADNAAAIDAAIALGERRMYVQLSDTVEQISRTLATADWGWRDQLTQASRALDRVVQDQARVLAGINLTVDAAALNRLLNDVETWRVLTREQRDRALDAVQSAYATAGTEPASDVLSDDLAAAVRDITDTEIGYLPIEVSRQNFVLFVGSVVLLSLMTLSFSSDTADGVMSKGIELSALAVLAAQAAGALWDRRNSARGNDQSSTHDD
ncbi:hypothetical protein [Streptomyces sp. NPDC088736]|uniref:hypothetical protein n=1 Tax=Streptomyces sp. NPDC088736 TaxID=3365881 RepID=UPI003804F747